MTLPPSLASARELVRTLLRLGVRDVVLAPGSRSAPLAYAVAAAAGPDAPDTPGEAVGGPRLRLHVRIDERDAAFLALGLARAGQLRADRAAAAHAGAEDLPVSSPPTAPPVAIVTTSGTAVANLLPAVLEAHHSGVPLLLLTADRPHELRGTGANQTTDQLAIFGSATRLTVDVPAPTGRPEELRDLRSVLTRALAAATGARTGHPGPVHLNLAYREPLAPDPAGLALLRDLTDLGSLPGASGVPGSGSGREVAGAGAARVLPRSLPVAAGTTTATALLLDVGVLDPAAEPATVVVAGDGAGQVARTLAEARGWPLLAEASSGAAGGPCLVRAHRLVLAGTELAAGVRQVVVLGRPTLSRPVQQLLAREQVRVVVVAPGSGPWPDAARNAAVVLDHVPASWLSPRPPAGSGVVPARDAATDPWRVASRAAEDVVGQAVGEGAEPLTALAVASAVAAASAPQDTLVIGSSSPVRDLDLVAAWTEPPTVVANRGLAGIDGIVSTATGVALGLQGVAPGASAAESATERPAGAVRALLGDLTFLHDVGGLLRGPGEPPVDLQLVVVNDDGGAIFAGLEHGRTGDPALFERVFATPHGADLGPLCAGYGVAHSQVSDLTSLAAALAAPPAGVSVVEVRVSRAAREGQESGLVAALRTALESPAEGR